MGSGSRARSVRWSRVAYRLLLAALPAEFRRLYAPEMAQVFRSLCADGHRQAGLVGVLRVWPGALRDWAGALVGEYVTSPTPVVEPWPRRPIRRSALVAGGVGGGLLGLYLALTNLAVLAVPTGSPATAGVLGVTGALCAHAGFQGARATGRLATGIRVGAAAGALIAVLMNMALTIVALVFFDALRRHAGADPDYLRSGTSSYGSYLVDDTVGGWLYGAAFCLVSGAGLGALGGIVGRWRGPRLASV